MKLLRAKDAWFALAAAGLLVGTRRRRRGGQFGASVIDSARNVRRSRGAAQEARMISFPSPMSHPIGCDMPG
jgi:hypothetical protein